MKLVSNRSKNWASFVFAIIFFQLSADVAIVLDVPVARQVIGGLYLTLVPGMVLLRIVGMHDLDLVEKPLFSVGLSVAFVMFLGLVVNQFGLSFKLGAVLTTPILLLATNSIIFFLCIVSYFLNRNMQLDLRTPKFSLTSFSTLFFPLLAILGTALVNFNGNSVILLLMIGVVALTVFISSVRARTNWSLILCMITVAVLFQTSLISNYIVGYDVAVAHQVFKITQSEGIWNPIINDTSVVTLRTNQMLSSTVFPTIYSSMLNLGGTWIFKIVYPLIFALIPVGLYQLYQKYIERKAAFVAAVLILADITFFIEMPGLPTQMISELFLVLLLIVIFHKKINSSKKTIFFAIFSAGIIVSHYGTSYVFMFLIFFVWLVCFLIKKQSRIGVLYVTLFFLLAFTWYIYTSQSASFTSLMDMGQNIYANFWSEFLNLQSRQELALRAIGAGTQAVSLGHWLGRGFHYVTQFFIVLGILCTVLRYEKRYRLDREYIVISIFMLLFAMLPLIAPSLNLLNVTRMYHISILFLAPFCVIGGDWFFSFLPKLRGSIFPFILTLIVITSLFLFETGFIYEITGDDSYSVSLSMYRMDRAIVYGSGYITECFDVAGAEWLHSNIVLTAKTLVYADAVSVIKPLTGYGVFPRNHIETLTNVTYFDMNEYVYLRNFNTFDGKIYGQGYVSGRVWNNSDISPRLGSLNKIYTNGGCEILFAFNKTGP